MGSTIARVALVVVLALVLALVGYGAYLVNEGEPIGWFILLWNSCFNAPLIGWNARFVWTGEVR
jgi:hypothetical protein